MVKDQLGQSVLTARQTCRVETGQHSADVFQPQLFSEDRRLLQGRVRTAQHRPLHISRSGSAQCQPLHCSICWPLNNCTSRCTAGCYTTVPAAANTILQEGSTEALPPDNVRLFLHALGPYLGVQTPLSSSQEDTLPGVQQTSSSYKNPSGTPQETTGTATRLGGVQHASSEDPRAPPPPGGKGEKTTPSELAPP